MTLRLTSEKLVQIFSNREYGMDLDKFYLGINYYVINYYRLTRAQFIDIRISVMST